MAGSRAAIRRKDCEIAPRGSPLLANDETRWPSQANIAAITIPEAPVLLPSPANDDWIEDDLPVSINVLADEVVLLHQHLRATILALFD